MLIRQEIINEIHSIIAKAKERSKYQLYLPTEEQLINELKKEIQELDAE